MKDTWEDVDTYFDDKLHVSDEITESILEKNEANDLPAIEVAGAHGKMLYLMAKMKNAKTILEIGTHGGFSTVWLGRALPENGQMATLEFNAEHADVAEENIFNAGLADKVKVYRGSALDTLPLLMEKGYRHFDFVFIDADKDNYPAYIRWVLEISKTGTVIVADNVVRNGKVADEETEEGKVPYIREFIDIISEDSRIEATALQTVSGKGYDGFLIGVVK